MIAFVEHPIAIATAIAFSNAARLKIFRGVRSSHTMSTIRRPLSDDSRICPASAARIELPPGSTIPHASAIAVIVLAVPIVMHVPYDRAIPPSTPSQSWSVIFPARSSSQYFQLSLPDPKVLPCQFPRNIGPAGKKIAGTFMLIAPSSSPGVLLSHPPISTAPSTGCARSSSSASIASIFL